ncbi:MAG TPA: 50S ribosomal protein L13 [Thermoanaerobaculia bacterium]|nr:50S ribosomal protein L13 [Thermoanaerobaculia bacterium]
MNRTYSPKASEIERGWWVIDAAGVPLGRLSSVVAGLIMGKHKPNFVPHLDTGDFVVVINAEKAVLTGRKEQQKFYYRHSGFPGGIKSESAEKLRQRRPELMIERAVWGMLPKNKLGRRLKLKVKVYAGVEHPHQAQQPAAFDVTKAI